VAENQQTTTPATPGGVLLGTDTVLAMRRRVVLLHSGKFGDCGSDSNITVWESAEGSKKPYDLKKPCDLKNLEHTNRTRATYLMEDNRDQDLKNLEHTN
jgi:hypothetical protein